MSRVVTIAAVMTVGLASVGGGIYFLRRLHGMARASGTIVDFERRFAGKTRADFPVVSFRVLDGAEIRTIVPQGRILSHPKMGTHVQVFYSPENPADALIGSAGTRFGGVIYILFGLSLLALVAVSAL